MQFMPDGHTMVVARYQNLRMFDLQTGTDAQVRENAHNMTILRIAVAPNGQQLATASYEKIVRLWDAATLECQATLQGLERRVRNIAYSADSSMFATCAGEEIARLWRAADGQLLYVLRSPGAWCESIGFAPDGRRLLAVGCFSKETRVRGLYEWSLPPGVPEATLRAVHKASAAVELQGRTLPLLSNRGEDKDSLAAILFAVLTSDCRRLCATVRDGNVLLLEAVTDASGSTTCYKLVSKHPAISHCWSACPLLPDGRLILLNNSHKAMIWNTATNTPQCSLQIRQNYTQRLVISSDSRQVASIDDDESMVSIDTLCTWTPSTHHLFAPSFRGTVFSLMCVRARLDRTSPTAPSLPRLPLELWLLVFEVLQVATECVAGSDASDSDDD